MAQTSPVAPVKLFVVTLHRDAEALNQTIARMKSLWGEIDWMSEDFPFVETHYYEKEMGPDLQRRFLSFDRLIPPDEIVKIKLQTNALE
jgi:hypothetical protein